MKLRSVPFSLTFAFDEVRALSRLRAALDVPSDTDVLRALVRAAHAEVCPDVDTDAALEAVHAERVERSKTRRSPRRRLKRPPTVRHCAWARCGQEFAVPPDNRAQKFCSRECSHKGRSR